MSQSTPSGDALWRTSDDPLALLDDLFPPHTHGSGHEPAGKCQLYLVACARRQWHRLPGVCRGLVELAEYIAERPRERRPLRAALAPIAEGLLNSADAKELSSVGSQLGHLTAVEFPHARETYLAGFAGGDRGRDPAVGDDAWRGLAALVYLPFVPTTPPFRWVPPELHSAALLREIYYNPHRFVPVRPEWRTDTVLHLARHAYDAREFSTLPFLADALQDAGCDNDDLLGHLRARDAVHVRGCWALGRVLDGR